MNEIVKELHEEFCRLTGQTLTLSYQRLWSWGEIAKRGYNTQDLAILIRWIKSQMTRHGSGYSASSLQFNVLISDPDKFEDRLNLARKAFPKRQQEMQKTTQQFQKLATKEAATDEDRAAFLEEIKTLRTR